MERKLLNWILLKEDWIIEYIKNLSDKNLHITLKSLYYHCKFNSNNNDEIYRNYILKEMEPIFLNNKNSEFVYGEYDLIRNKIKEIYKNKETQENFNLIAKPLFTCLDIIRNNKRLLIKKENINLKFNEFSGQFFLKKIWRNNVIRKEIIYYLSIFKFHRFKMTFTSIQQFQKYKFKDYLDHIELSFSNSNSNIDGELINNFLENDLPSSVRKLQINSNDNNYQPYTEYIKPLSMPPSITYLNFNSINYDSFQTNFQFIDFDLPILKNDNLNGTIKKIIITNHDQKINNELNFKTDPYDTSPNKFGLNKSDNQTIPTTITYFNYDLNFIIERNFFPESITILKLGQTQFTYSKEKIKVGVLPSKLIELDLGGYNNEIEEDVLPSTLKSLKLCKTYNKTIKMGCLPSSLEYLSFHGDEGIKPPHEKSVRSFWSFFSKSQVEPIPQPVLIVGSLPIGLKTLKLSSYQSFLDILISEVLSISHKSLIKLSIIQNKIYDYQNQKELSDRDAILKFNNWKDLNFKIPPSVKVIKFNTNRYFQFLEDSLPFTHFKTNSTWQIKTLPNTLKSISLNTKFDYYSNKNFITNYPNSLETLTIGSIADIPLNDSLPNSLTRLDLFYDSSFIPNFNHNILKCSKLFYLKVLSLPSTFSQDLNIDLKFPNLEILFVGSSNPNIIISQNTLKLKEIIVFYNNHKFIDNNIQFYPLFKVYGE
ncbi:hypothetical protein ACTA71_010011 [Dictyostelium dimigraforme]